MDDSERLTRKQNSNVDNAVSTIFRGKKIRDKKSKVKKIEKEMLFCDLTPNKISHSPGLDGRARALQGPSSGDARAGPIGDTSRDTRPPPSPKEIATTTRPTHPPPPKSK